MAKDMFNSDKRNYNKLYVENCVNAGDFYLIDMLLGGLKVYMYACLKIDNRVTAQILKYIS